MELYFNHKAIEFSNSDASGIQLASYNAGNVAAGAQCTRDANPQCKDFEVGKASLMNEEQYNFKTLYPNNSPPYG